MEQKFKPYLLVSITDFLELVLSPWLFVNIRMILHK